MSLGLAWLGVGLGFYIVRLSGSVTKAFSQASQRAHAESLVLSAVYLAFQVDIVVAG